MSGDGVCRQANVVRRPGRSRAGRGCLCLPLLVLALCNAAPRASAQQEFAVTDQPLHDASAIVGVPGQSVLVAQEADGVDAVVVPETNGLESGLDAWSTDADGACVECQSSSCTGGHHHGWHRRLRHGVVNRLLGAMDGRWTMQVDALMLWPANIQSRPLLENFFTGETALDVDDADAPMSAGARYGLIYRINACHALEGNYFNVGRFPGEQIAVDEFGEFDPVALPVPIPFPTAFGAIETEGRIQSAEFNTRYRHCESPVTWIAGFRWVQWNQGLSFVAAADDGSFGALASQVGNDLYGGQVGADLSLWNAGGRVTINGVGKAGVFGNVAWQRTAGLELFDGEITVDGPLAADADRVAFFGEVGLNGSLAITRWLSWRLGYSLFWLSGVAVPGNQISEVDFTTDTADINTSGSVLLHGVTTGIEARW